MSKFTQQIELQLHTNERYNLKIRSIFQLFLSFEIFR